MATKITETGPQTYLTIQSQIGNPIDKAFKKQDRERFLKEYEIDPLSYDTYINEKGAFNDSATERLFRDTMFKEAFSERKDYNKLKNLSPEDSDLLYYRTQYLPSLQEKSRKNKKEEIPSTEESIEQTDNIPSNISTQSNEVDTLYFNNSDIVTEESEESDLVEDLKDLIKSTVKTKKDAAHALLVDAPKKYEEYKSNPDLLDSDIENLKKVAPMLSSYYEEFLNGNKELPLKEEDINWEILAPSLTAALEAGKMEAASDLFNKYLMNKMNNNLNFWQKQGRWWTRFGASLGLMAVDVGGLVEGLVTSPFKIVKGINNKDNAGKIAADVFVNTNLGKWSYEQQEKLREEYNLYNPNFLLDPESASFMASMILPGGAITKLGKLTKAAEATEKLNKAQKVWRTLNGSKASYAKAEKNVAKVLEKADDVQHTAVKMKGIEAEEAALKQGKSLAEARQAAHDAQVTHLANVYQKGKVQRAQLATTSYIEAQWEAIGAEESVDDEFQKSLDKQRVSVTEQLFNADEDEIKDLTYAIGDYDRHIQEALDAGRLEELKEMYREQYPEASEEDIIHAANDHLKEESKRLAMVDYYMASNMGDFEAKKLQQESIAALTVLAQNYFTLRLTEGLGGWTTRLAPYKKLSATANETNFLQRVWRRGRDKMGATTSFNSENARMMARVAFDEAGNAVRRVTPKGIFQTFGRFAGTLGIESGQEVLQEFASAGAEGAGHHNAEEFVMSHLAGPGRSTVEEAYDSMWLSAINNFSYNRNWNDYWHIIAATSLQMGIGTPSVLKLTHNFDFGKDPQTNKFKINYNPVIRGSYESEGSYIARNIERWLPVNSPILQNLMQEINTNENVRTFIKTYNNYLDDSKNATNYASSTLNYAAKAYMDAEDKSKVDYDHDLFAARFAEAIFISQLRGANRDTRMAIYSNMADINTKRKGESDEDFAKRRANTLKELREEANNNTMKEASDEDLSRFAEENGKLMLDTIESLSERGAQLYEQYEGELPWELMYGRLYNEAASEYTKNQIAEYENIVKKATPYITNTQLTDEDVKNKVLNESAILALNAEDRQSLIENAKGKQLSIVNNLLSQLEQVNTDEKLGRNVKEDLQNAAKEYKKYRELASEQKRLVNNPREWLKRIWNKQAKREATLSYDFIIDTINDNTLSKEAKQEAIGTELDTLKKSLDRGTYMTFLAALYESPKTKELLDKIITADTANNNELLKAVEAITRDKKLKGNSEYSKVADKIRNTHFDFRSNEIELLKTSTSEETPLFSAEELELIKELRAKSEELQALNPTIEAKDQVVGKKVPVDEVEEVVDDVEFTEQVKSTVRSQVIVKLKNILRSISSIPSNTYDKYLNELEGILSQDFNSVEELIKNINVYITKSEDAMTKGLLKSLVAELTDFTPERVNVDSKTLDITAIDLADPNYFLASSERSEGNFAKFFRRYNIIELLKSGKLKEGTKIYVLWDSEFIEETKQQLASISPEALPEELRQVGLVAVVEGAIDGYPSITVDGKTYTRIGLFNAYGKGHYNSKDMVAYMISQATGKPFKEGDPIPNMNNTIIKDEKGQPIEFTLSHINEGSYVPTPEQENSVKDLSTEAQAYDDKLNNEEYNEEQQVNRGKDFFIQHVFAKGKQIFMRFTRQNQKGYADIPIHVKKIVDTSWNNTTVGEALKEHNVGLITEENGNPILNDVATFLSGFMTHPTIKSAIQKFNTEVTRLQKKKKNWLNSREYKEAVATLNKSCNSALNATQGFTLANRLYLSSELKYMIIPEIATNPETNETSFKFNLAVGQLKDSIPMVDSAIIFMTYDNFAGDELLAGVPSTEIIIAERLIDAINTLIIDPITGKERVVTKNEKETPLVMWQANFKDINKEGDIDIAEKLVGRLYDMDVFTVQTQTFISSKTSVRIVPSNDYAKVQKAQEERKKQEQELESKKEDDFKKGEEKIEEDNDFNKKNRVKILNLKKVDDSTREGNEQFEYVGSNILIDEGVEDTVVIDKVGITENNECHIFLPDIYWKDGKVNPKYQLSVETALTNLGFGKDNIIYRRSGETQTSEEEPTVPNNSANPMKKVGSIAGVLRNLTGDALASKKAVASEENSQESTETTEDIDKIIDDLFIVHFASWDTADLGDIMFDEEWEGILTDEMKQRVKDRMKQVLNSKPFNGSTKEFTQALIAAQGNIDKIETIFKCC